MTREALKELINEYQTQIFQLGNAGDFTTAQAVFEELLDKILEGFV